MYNVPHSHNLIYNTHLCSVPRSAMKTFKKDTPSSVWHSASALMQAHSLRQLLDAENGEIAQQKWLSCALMCKMFSFFRTWAILVIIIILLISFIGTGCVGIVKQQCSNWVAWGSCYLPICHLAQRRVFTYLDRCASCRVMSTKPHLATNSTMLIGHFNTVVPLHSGIHR